MSSAKGTWFRNVRVAIGCITTTVRNIVPLALDKRPHALGPHNFLSHQFVSLVPHQGYNTVHFARLLLRLFALRFSLGWRLGSSFAGRGLRRLHYGGGRSPRVVVEPELHHLAAERHLVRQLPWAGKPRAGKRPTVYYFAPGDTAGTS